MGDSYAAAYNALYRGSVVPTPAGQSGIWVTIPRLNGPAPLGPVQYLHHGVPDPDGSYLTSAPAPGTAVLLGTVAGLKDDLVILGALAG